MQYGRFMRLVGLLPALALAVISANQTSFATPTNVFFTQFESGQGYNPELDLIGQQGWQGEGSGGNGLVADFFPGQGQQAYIGFDPPAGNEDQLIVWHPINFDPLAAGLPIVEFSVLMSIEDSTEANASYDYFRWSVYNSQVDRLFSIEFDNFFTCVNYLLNGTNTIVTNVLSYLPGQDYTLTVTMNFASNRWSAALAGALIATNQPITTTGAPLDLGDVDAVWLIYDPATPGDNYMLFDNYRITAEAVPAAAPAQVQFLERTSGGSALLRVVGPNDTRWSLDATTNFVNWTALKTNIITGGYFDHVDLTAASFPRRFYRARLVP